MSTVKSNVVQTITHSATNHSSGPVVNANIVCHSRKLLLEGMPSPPSPCFFKGCDEPVCPGSIKCLRHKKKGICRYSGCCNQVNKRGVCVSHGARDVCIIPGCNSLGRSSGLCSRHAKDLKSTGVKGDYELRRRAQFRDYQVIDALYRVPEEEDVVTPDLAWPQNAEDMDVLMGEWMMCAAESVVMTDILPDEDWPLLCQLLAPKDETSNSIEAPSCQFQGGRGAEPREGLQASNNPTRSAKVIFSDVCIQPYCAAFDHRNMVDLTDATHKDAKEVVHCEPTPCSSSSWLTWCQSNPSMLLLKDIMTFIGVDGDGPHHDGAIEGLVPLDPSCEFHFVPV